ncbi:MAG: glycosyltransferase family 4 protein [Thermotogota bacterium]|nr:glycosyltransferase family 4 protein [Thermotogota bacterium]
MKICMVCLGLGNLKDGVLVGGHENTVIRLSKALYAHGHEIIIITTSSIHHSPIKEVNIVELDWGRIFSLPVSGDYGSLRYGFNFILKAILKMKQLNREEKKIDIVHGHSGYPVLGLITGIGGKMLGIPSIHSLYCPIESHIFKNRFLKLYLSLIEMIVSLSENTRESLMNLGMSKDKIVVIPPAIDLNLFHPDLPTESIRKELNIESNTHLLLYVGDLTKTRGLYCLIDALDATLEQSPNTNLLLAVNMPLDRYKQGKFEIKEKISSFGLDDNVIPLGIVNNMPEVMNASDIFIASYLSIESIADYPISLLEAMACGKPAIATSVGGIPEVIKHKKNGLLVQPGDAQELKNAICYIFDNKDEAKNMGDNAATYVAENYGIEAIVNKLEKVYEELVNP